MNILFIHSSWPNQFMALHRYFRRTGVATSWCLVCESDRRANELMGGYLDGVLSYSPDGEPGEEAYYFSQVAERNARNAIAVLRAVRAIVEEHRIDVIVAHGILGNPHLLFDEIPCPIVSYVEFPSFCHHGWDPLYPPDDAQRYCGKYEEMLSHQVAIKSDRVIVPSDFVRRMFPERLRSNIVVQMDGFDAEALTEEPATEPAFERLRGCFYVSFTASTLSSEKGIEHFILVSRRLAQLDPRLRFVVIGGLNGPSYGFERMFLDRREPRVGSFIEFLVDKYDIDGSRYLFTGRLDPARYSSTLRAVDLCLYPLQFGGANWGLFELLLRGKLVVASDRCFIPEVIVDGDNGLLLPYEDQDAWVRLVLRIAQSPSDFEAIGRRAAESVRRFHIEPVARNYVGILEQAVLRRPLH